ncbi:MAG: aminopeptidase N [Actinobacteria bacterium]|nr:aminopeptidase N [Actinomycetota bacterium]
MSDSSDVLDRQDAADRADLLSDLAYDVELDLGDGRGETFRSTSTVRFTSATKGAATFIDLTAPEVLSVTLNGEEVAADDYDGHRLHLMGLAAHNELVVVARCAFQRTGTGLHRFVDPADDAVYLHTQFEPFDAHTTYACFDQPDLKARFRLTVHAPSDWTVVSNEPVASRHTDEAGVDTWRFEATPPISTYITALVAGPLHAVVADETPVPMTLYCRASLARYLEPDEMFEIAGAGVEFYRRMFGHPYPFSKYDQLFVPEFNFGAMENAGCVTFSESYLFRSKVTDAERMARGATILHELAHMWFGNLVTMRWWGDLWLNESFATYVSFWALAEATRFTDAWVQFVNSELTWAIRQDQLPTTHPIVADAHDTDTALNNFDGITYAKGALVLTQLVAWVGSDAFVDGLRDYFGRHAWGNATLDDFLTALEKTSGRALGRWARQWLQTTGVNTLELVTTTDDDGCYVAAEVRQHPPARHTGDRHGDDGSGARHGDNGDGQLRDQRIAIGLYDTDGDALVHRTTAELDVTGARTPVPTIVGHPVAALALPNDGLRSYAKVRLDDGSLDTLREHLGTIREPLTRAHGWLLSWDLVRDAVLPAHQYVQLVADHAGGEEQLDTLRTLLRQAIAAADRYGAPHRRGAAHAVLADAARAALERCAPGSDAQLVWTRCLMAVGDPAWTQRVLDGDDVPAGLTVDHDLRWYGVIRLAAQGATDEDAIERTYRGDRTDEGQRRATTALAARPLAGAKERAWVLAQDRDETLALRRAAIAGFHQYDQAELLAPYVDRYVDELDSLWRRRVRQESLDLTKGLFPRTVVDESTVAAGERALRTPRLPDAGRRIIVEQLDELRRVLRTRAADSGGA